MATGTLFIVFIVLMVLGTPLAVTFAMSAALPITIFGDAQVITMIQRFFSSADSFSLLAAPFFIMSGGFLDKGGVSKRLVDLANSLVGWLPGGLGVVVFLSCAFFGAISGSAIATVVTIGAILVPAMIREGYPRGLAVGTVACGGWLGIIVPPSVPMILYGNAVNANVGDLFMGGFIPGFILAAFMSIVCVMWGIKHRNTIVRHPFKISNVWKTLKDAFWALLMPIIILGGIYSGIFTPTEAGAVSIVYGLIAGFLIYKELKPSDLLTIVRDAIKTTSTLLFVIAGATFLGYVMTIYQIPQICAEFIVSIAHTRFQFWVLITVFLLFVGCIMDTAPAILILSPIIASVLPNYDIPLVQFGIVMIVNLGIGLCTPPVGMNLYVASNSMKVPVKEVLNRQYWLYLFAALVGLVLLMAFPDIIMFLPKLFAK